MGETLRAAYQTQALLPAAGCPSASEVVVWADGADQRTRRSGEVLAEALGRAATSRPGGPPRAPRPHLRRVDGSNVPIDVDQGRASMLKAAGPGGLGTSATRAAVLRLQGIIAPTACRGGLGTCFSTPDTLPAARPRSPGPMSPAASLAEDLLLDTPRACRRRRSDGQGRVRGQDRVRHGCARADLRDHRA